MDMIGSIAILLAIPAALIAIGWWPLAIVYFIGLGAILQ